MFFLNISASSPICAHSITVLNGTLVLWKVIWPMDCERKCWVPFPGWAFTVDLKTYSVSFLFSFRKMINNVQHMESFLNLGSLNKNDGYEKTKSLSFKSLRFGS